MDKTFTYIIIVIAVYLLVIFPKVAEKSQTTENAATKTEEKEKITEKKKDENGVTKGAGGRLKYGIGYTN